MRSVARAPRAPVREGRLARPAPVRDRGKPEARDAPDALLWRPAFEPFRVRGRRVYIPRLGMERHERLEDLAIPAVRLIRGGEDLQSSPRLAYGVERNGPDVHISDAPRRGLCRALEFDDGFGHALLTDERQAEGVPEPGVSGRRGEAAAEHRLGIDLPALHAMDVREVRVSPGERG